MNSRQDKSEKKEEFTKISFTKNLYIKSIEIFVFILISFGLEKEKIL